LRAKEGDFKVTTLIPTNQIKAGEDKFIGVKGGDVITFDIRETFGDDNSALAHVTGISKQDAENLNGEFELEVEKINRTTPAEMDQEFFDKIFGKDAVTTQEDFDAKVRETIKENYDREAENVLNSNLIKTLVEDTNIEIPEEFFKRWLAETNRNKLTPEQIEQNYGQYVRELKWSLIRNKVVEENDLKISNEEIVDSVKQKMLAQFNLPEVSEEMEESMNQFANNYLQQDNGKHYMNEYENLLAEKVLAVLKEKVTVNEKSISAEDFRNLSFE
ncbi:MAG: trigger factor, partial [Hymenobacteraceae bacterium]|nr:trigger factor [Hymenobacteraceae bacterium]MDX5396008.1 trigger factor [Hymenobacteraceae bacterium]MDX5512068.1 trigger factor [Hymenobacteraceae bacterium]